MQFSDGMIEQLLNEVEQNIVIGQCLEDQIIDLLVTDKSKTIFCQHHPVVFKHFCIKCQSLYQTVRIFRIVREVYYTHSGESVWLDEVCKQ